MRLDYDIVLSLELLQRQRAQLDQWRYSTQIDREERNPDLKLEYTVIHVVELQA